MSQKTFLNQTDDEWDRLIDRWAEIDAAQRGDDPGPDLTDGATMSIARYLVCSAVLLLLVGLVALIRVTR